MSESFVRFEGGRSVRMEHLKDCYVVTWYKPDEDNGAILVGSTVVLSELAMSATIAAWAQLNPEQEPKP